MGRRCLSRRRPRRLLRDKLIKNEVREISKVLYANGKDFYHSIFEGPRVYEPQNTITLTSDFKLQEDYVDFALPELENSFIFPVSFTELCQKPGDTLHGLITAEEELVLQGLESLEIPYRASEEEVLERLGMHIVNLNEEESGEYDLL